MGGLLVPKTPALWEEGNSPNPRRLLGQQDSRRRPLFSQPSGAFELSDAA